MATSIVSLVAPCLGLALAACSSTHGAYPAGDGGEIVPELTGCEVGGAGHARFMFDTPHGCLEILLNRTMSDPTPASGVFFRGQCVGRMTGELESSDGERVDIESGLAFVHEDWHSTVRGVASFTLDEERVHLEVPETEVNMGRGCLP